MSTLKHLLQEADPLRHEGPPSLEAARERIQSAQSPAASVGQPQRVRRRSLGLASVSATLVLILSWASYHDWFPTMVSVAAQVRFEVRLAEGHPVPGLRVEQIGNSGSLIYLHTETVVGNDDIDRAWVVDDGSLASVSACSFSRAARLGCAKPPQNT